MINTSKIKPITSQYLIICNGELTKTDLQKILRKNSFKKIICCDGASHKLKKWNIIPNIIIGDMDGSSPEVVRFFRKKNVKIKKIYDQNRNDLEKALDLTLAENINSAVVAGFAGKRLDHTYGNLSILTRYSERMKQLILYDSGFRGEFVSGEHSFKCKKSSVISILPLPSVFVEKTTGLKWSLKNETLSFSMREGTLNIATGSFFSLSIKTGLALVFFKDL